MYYFLKRVGSNYSIIDTDDGVIDWMSKEELEGYVVGSKIPIQGVAKDMSELKPQVVVLDAAKCNWADGENVFAVVKSFFVTMNGSFTMKAGKKKFKGVIHRVNDSLARLEFNYGVHVEIPISDFQAIRANYQDVVLPMLKACVASK